MNLYCDECISPAIVAQLRSDGHAVFSAGELDPSATDRAVLQAANEHQAALLTEDGDFGELVFRLGYAHSGVILVRLHGASAEEKAAIISTAISQWGVDMVGAFTVIGSRTVRIRPRPNA